VKNLATGALLFNLAVIVWGAYVRASGSGAGCGSHWPLCNGQIIPRTGLIETAVEFAHRVTSGISLLLAVGVAWVGTRNYPKGHAVRSGAWAVLIFTLMEAIIGAGLVLFGYTAHDQSVGRVVSISLHLSNTFLLLASLALTAWWSRLSVPYRLQSVSRRNPRLWRVAITSWVLTIALGVTGAVTALGDTLFHSTSLTQGMGQDFTAASHFLLKLRVIHPVWAVLTGAWLFYFAEMAADQPSFCSLNPPAQRFSYWLKALVALQLVLGLSNLLLLAPTALQLAHLFVAECVWIALVLTTASSLQAHGAVAGTA
jgi:heme A synthase